MTSRHKNWRWLATAAVATLAMTAFVAAACGGDDDNNGDGAAATPTAARTQAAASPTAGAATPASGSPTAGAVTTPPAGGGSGATIATAEDATLGTILVDSRGFTLYTFNNDTAGNGESACYGGCASNWPPLTADGEPTAGSGINGELSTIERTDGTTQVTYKGLPLYFFASDAAPGDTNGQGVAGIWFVAMP